MTNSVDITRIINEAKIAVDDSAFGPLFVTTAENIADKKINNFAWAVFNMVFQTMLAKELRGEDKTGNAVMSEAQDKA